MQLLVRVLLEQKKPVQEMEKDDEVLALDLVLVPALLTEKEALVLDLPGAPALDLLDVLDPEAAPRAEEDEKRTTLPHLLTIVWEFSDFQDKLPKKI